MNHDLLPEQIILLFASRLFLFPVTGCLDPNIQAQNMDQVNSPPLDPYGQGTSHEYQIKGTHSLHISIWEFLTHAIKSHHLLKMTNCFLLACHLYHCLHSTCCTYRSYGRRVTWNWPCALGWVAAVIARKLLAMSVKPGLSTGSDAQHLSINNFQLGSHQVGTFGRRVLLTMPPAKIPRQSFQFPMQRSNLFPSMRQGSAEQTNSSDHSHHQHMPSLCLMSTKVTANQFNFTTNLWLLHSVNLHKAPLLSEAPTLQFRRRRHQPVHWHKQKRWWKSKNLNSILKHPNEWPSSQVLSRFYSFPKSLSDRDLSAKSQGDPSAHFFCDHVAGAIQQLRCHPRKCSSYASWNHCLLLNFRQPQITNLEERKTDNNPSTNSDTENN